MIEVKPATDEEIAYIEAIYADNPCSMWDFTIEECIALIARIRKAEAQRDEAIYKYQTEVNRRMKVLENYRLVLQATRKSG